MEIAISIAYFLLFVFIISKWNFFRCEGLSRKSISLLFLLKVGFGVLLWAIYTYYYTYRDTSDAFRYFDDAMIIYQSLPQNPSYYFQIISGIHITPEELAPYFDQMEHWYRPYTYSTYNDNRLLIKFNALVLPFSFGYYNVHTVFMCFLSLIGLTAIYKTFYPYLKQVKHLLLLSIFLVPNVLFWGSGVLKEGAVLFSLGIFVYALFRIFFQKEYRAAYFIIILLSFLLLLFLKTYIIISLMPSILGLTFFKKVSPKRPALTYLSAFLACFIIALALPYFTSLDILYMLHKKQHDFINVAHDWNAGSFFDAPILEPNAFSLLKNTPAALFNALFRPLPWTADSMLQLLSAAENIFVAAFGVICVIFMKPIRKINKEIFYFVMLYSIVLLILIGLVTPIAGAIVRYKVPVIPFLLISFLLLLDPDKLCRKIPIFKKLIA